MLPRFDAIDAKYIIRSLRASIVVGRGITITNLSIAEPSVIKFLNKHFIASV